MAGEPLQAVGSLADLGFIAEELYGIVPPSPALTVFPRLTTSLNLQKESYRSGELRRNRIPRGVRHGVRRVSGEIQTEIAALRYDTALQALMGGTWTTGVSASQAELTNVTCFSSGGVNRFDFAAGDPVALGFRKGDAFFFTGLGGAGAANNNKDFTIIGFGGTTNRQVTVAETVIADGSPDTAFTVAVRGSKLLIGNIYRSFTFERAFTDINQYLVYTGCRFSSLGLSLPPTGIATATWGIVGQDMKEASPLSLDPTYTDPLPNAPSAAIDGELFENGISMGLVTGLELTLDNGMGGKPVVGRNTIPNQLFGNMQNTTGRATITFQDAVMLNKFINETPSSLTLRLDDPNGVDFLKLHLPRIKYSGGDIGDSDPTGIPITMPFEIDDPTGIVGEDITTVSWQRST